MKKPSIVIHIEDDIISAVYADGEVDVYVVLKDSNGLEEDHPHYVKKWDANVWKEDVEIDPPEVGSVQKEWEVCG